ncbi:hypothetical protein [Streptomyces catenulae]|uniref:Uncharacterized protein n=1 Tax=Streptomyces catenulae TaxID=66875 RepID=A0ABV2Z3J6_9ACTN|nr:hypothetical protein [Streptomyces catenulae]
MTPPSEPRCACGELAIEDYYVDSASGPVRAVSRCRLCRYAPDDGPSPRLRAIARRGASTFRNWIIPR